MRRRDSHRQRNSLQHSVPCSLRRLLMRNRHNFVAVLSVVVLVCCAALILGQKVNAAGEGKISGSVKLDGTPPQIQGIALLKDPYCSKAHTTDPPHLAPSV